MKNDDFFLPGDTSQQKPILFSTATELELGPGVAESPTSKLIRMEFKVRSEHGSVWFLSVSISTIWKLEVLIKTLIPYVYTVCVVDKKCSGGTFKLIPKLQVTRSHDIGPSETAFSSRPEDPGSLGQLILTQWSNRFLPQISKSFQARFLSCLSLILFFKQKIAGVLHVSGFGGFSHFWNPLEVSHFHSPASGGRYGCLWVSRFLIFAQLFH